MGNKSCCIMHELRKDYHKKICNNLLFYRNNKKTKVKYLSVADSGNKTSCMIAETMAELMGSPLAKKSKSGQAIGTAFSSFTKNFLEIAFKHISHLRPGKWVFSTSQASAGITAFDQYEYLTDLRSLLDKINTIEPLKNTKELKALKVALEGEYLIAPDIIVAREAVSDMEINKMNTILSVTHPIGTLTPLRESNYQNKKRMLHASVSCKWSMRSDRAQNTRTEALNLIRNRKGKTPHIVAVTFEPLPSRLSSIAYGTGDLDCTYHAALYELIESVQRTGNDEAINALHTMVEGRRLRDISDLPFDLAI